MKPNSPANSNQPVTSPFAVGDSSAHPANFPNPNQPAPQTTTVPETPPTKGNFMDNPPPIDVNLPPVVTPPSSSGKKFGTGKIIATIFGLIVILGGLGAGILLVRQNQNIREKAQETECTPGDYDRSCTGNDVGQCPNCGEAVRQCDASGHWGASFGECRGECAADSCGGGSQCGGGECSQNGSCEKVDNYNECCGDGLSKHVTRSKGGDGSCQYQTGECNQQDTACKTATPTPQGGCCTGSGQGSCRSWEVCDIPNAGCASGKSCRSTQGCTLDSDCGPGNKCINGNCNVSGNIQCTATKDGTTVENKTDKTLNCTASSFACFVERSTQASCTNGCGGSPSSSSFTLPPGGSKDFGGASGSCGSWQTDLDVSCGSYHCVRAASGCDWSGSCGGTPPPSGSQSAQCVNIVAYDTNWNILDTSKLALLKAGDKVRFAVSGTAAGVSIDKARFVINGASPIESSQVKPGTSQFYYEYTIPTTATPKTFTVGSQLHIKETNQWF